MSFLHVAICHNLIDDDVIPNSWIFNMYVVKIWYVIPYDIILNSLRSNDFENASQKFLQDPNLVEIPTNK